MTMNDPECDDCGGTGWWQEAIVDHDTGMVSSRDRRCERRSLPGRNRIPVREFVEVGAGCR